MSGLIDEYQASLEYNEDGEVIKKNELVEQKLTLEILKIVKAVINKRRYYVFEDYDDLIQHGIMNCFTNFAKFNTSKGSAFNFFTKISHTSLLNYTLRRKKHRVHTDIETQDQLIGRYSQNKDFFFDNLEVSLFKIIDENFVGNRRKKYVMISSLILDYMKKTEKFISKSDLYSWMRSYGIKNVEVREFIRSIEQYSEHIFDILEE